MAIIGAGPAGLAAGIWCGELGLRSVVIEQQEIPGGQLNRIFGIVANIPAMLPQRPGTIKDRLLKQFSDTGDSLLMSSVVRRIDLSAKRILFEKGEINAFALIVATGVRRRELSIPGESEFAGKGVLVSGRKESGRVSGLNVIVVGGGDAALENSILLGRNARQVTIVHRGPRFSARSEFVEKARSMGNIEFRFFTEIAEILGQKQVEAVRLKQRNSREELVDADAVVIRIGVTPNSELFRDGLDLDANGYILVNREAATNVPLVYAIGDVANPHSPTIATAFGTAVSAVKDIEDRLRNQLRNGRSR